GLGFRVQGSGFRVQGSRFRVQGSGFRVQGSGFRVQGLVCRGVGDLVPERLERCRTRRHAFKPPPAAYIRIGYYSKFQPNQGNLIGISRQQF
ncbi:hypothetical protein T484DRAFT_1649986, partial [Baffinella frigidus]